MISGKTMTFSQRKQLVNKYIVGHYFDRFAVKISENNQAIADWLAFAFKLQDQHLLSSLHIKNFARKRARDLDDQMSEKLSVERNYKAIDEFIQVSILGEK